MRMALNGVNGGGGLAPIYKSFVVQRIAAGAQ